MLAGMLAGCKADQDTMQHELNILDDNYRNFYEIFVASFYDSDGDGMGDLNGVTEKLDYIQDMGFTGIWLMPVMPAPSYHKYDTTDYRDIDEAYGTLEDFENLLRECHERGIYVVIDFVINHSSNQHPWFLEACDYLSNLPEGQEPDAQECPYVEYYHFSREQVNSSYAEIPGGGWYYEAVFYYTQPDLNWENEAVREEFDEITKFWVDLGVDGFRVDAAMHFNDSDTEENLEILNRLYTCGLSVNPDFYMVSEVWANESTVAKYYESLTPSMFNFDTCSAEGKLVRAAKGSSDATKLVHAMLDYQETFSAENPDYIDAPFLTNHDQVRVANNLQSNENDLKMACGLLMMMSGNPFVYYGEEIGMSSKGTKDENKRLPMLWSDTDKIGMTEKPEGADDGIESAFPAVDEQLEDPNSLLNYYKRALRLRNENPEIARGTITIVESLCEGDQAVITKTYDGSTIGIVYNTSDDTLELSLAGTELTDMELRGELTLNGERVTLAEDVLQMPPQSVCILK
ncbi:MAG: alpha amylase [Lachnospiraceae bacterium]|nr:alpha amylase [Lachnospiraceae bacterium]